MITIALKNKFTPATGACLWYSTAEGY